MKKCNKCEIEKPYEEFWKCKTSADGYHLYCKQCSNSWRKEYLDARPELAQEMRKRTYQKHRESRLERVKKYWENLSPEKKEARNAKQRERYKNNLDHRIKKTRYLREIYAKEKTDANVQVKMALKNGKLIRPELCQVCNKKRKLDGHHSDYSKPLQVLWVCRKCHMAIHKSLKTKDLYGTNHRN